MATRKTTKSSTTAAAAAKKAAKPRRKPAAKRNTGRAAPKMSFAMPEGMPFPDMSKMQNMLTPEQAIDLYKANAAMALEIINTAIDGTARLRRKQFEGEEEVRSFQKKAAQSTASARDAQGLMQAGQGVATEALEKSMKYWGEMFDLITEIQKRLFTLMEQQAAGMPGVKQAKAALAMMPDLKGMQNVVQAMQGVVGSGSNAFESMQKVMADFTKMAQNSIPGMKR
jgi:hypothetical protein